MVRFPPIRLEHAAVELRRVSKAFGTTCALRDVDLQVRAGELVVLLGSNGAGKTTALSLMLGLRAPTSGTVRVAGRNPRHHSGRGIVGGMVQGVGIPGFLRLGELLRLFAKMYASPAPAGMVLRLVELEDKAHHYAGSLSAGERQRLLLAIALVGNPAILFLDEPTVFMDVQARPRFWRLIRELAHRGRTILMTTHHPDEADALADRVVVMDGGAIIAGGSPGEIKLCAGAARLEEAVFELVRRRAEASR